MVVTVSTHRKVSQTDAAEIASHKGGRIGICEACGYEWSARSTKGAKPSRCPECGSSKRVWEDQMSAEALAEIEPLRHTVNRKLAEPGTLKETLNSPPKPTPAARETAKQTTKIADVAKVAEAEEPSNCEAKEGGYYGTWTMIPGKHIVSVHRGKDIGSPCQASRYYLGYFNKSGFFRIPESNVTGYKTPYEAKCALEKIASEKQWEPTEVVAEPTAAEPVTEPEKISLAGLPEGAVQTIQNPAHLADNSIAEPGYVAWENEAGETEYGVIVREDLLEAMQETVAAETAAAIVPVGLEDVEILREAGLLDVAEVEEPEDEDEHDDPDDEEEIEEEETEAEDEDEPETKKQGIPVVGALLILGGMAAIAYLTIKAPVTQKITRKEPSAAEKAMYRVSPAGKLDDTLTRISRNAA